jgi:hypothetical protein
MNVQLESSPNPGAGEPNIGVFVTLSERNLRDLLAQFEDDRLEGSVPRADLRRRMGNVTLVVQVEGDPAHYGTRTPGIGSGLLDRYERR